jgi:hypothetical protein
MKRIHVMAVVTLVAVIGTAAVAQTKPGGNVPTSQGPCALGYDASAPNGRMRLEYDLMSRFDLDDDGNINRTEFNAACAQGFFEEGKGG